MTWQGERRGDPFNIARPTSSSLAQQLIQRDVPSPTLHRKMQLTAWSAQLDDFRPLPTVRFTLDDHGTTS